jgi:hypothetical protein
MRQGLPQARVPLRQPLLARLAPFLPISLASMALAALLLTPACQRADAETATRGLEQALHDTRASLTAIGMPPGADGTPVGRVIPLPPPPSASTARSAGASPPATAATLQGRTPEQVLSALGEPALRRREGDSEVWLYQAADCRLDLVFYPEAAQLILAHAEARALGARRLTEAACLAAIAAAPHPPPWTLAGSAGGG